MAMRRACGFEAGSVEVTDGQEPLTGAAASAVQARSGTYSVFCTSSFNGIRFNTYVLGQDEWYIQAAVYITSIAGTWDGGIFGLYDRAGGEVGWLVFSNVTGLLFWINGNSVTLCGSAVPTPINDWVCFEAHIVVAGGVGGSIEVRMNGTSIMSAAGVDTLGAAAFSEVAMMRVSGGKTGIFARGFPGYIDDVVMNDTTGVYNTSWPDQLGLWPVVPEGVGTTTMLTPTAGDNWDCVEETPPSDADYVYHETLDNFDTYEASDIAVAGLVRGVVKWVRAREDIASARDVAMMWRINGTDYTGSDHGIDTSFTYYNELDETSPDTGVPFTTTEINAAEIGVKVR